MSLDPNVVLSSMLGSLITISGSIAVAVLYIRNQNKSEMKRRLHDRIEETYFEQGLLPMQAALSEYGTTAVFALADARMWVARCLIHGDGDVKFLGAKLEEIAKRPAVVDLTNHNFTLAMKWFPTLQKFGTAFYTSIKRTFQLYSSLVSDVLSLRHLQRNIKESSVDEVVRSLAAIAQLLDMTLMYLEKRFINLKDYFWQRDLESYENFSKMFLEQKYNGFLSVMDRYKDGLTQLMDALKSPKSEDRKETTLSFSKWLGENMDSNPLD